MKPELLHILQHSLGVDHYGRGRQYRNHYVAGSDDIEKCRELVALGYMNEYPRVDMLTGGNPLFHVTDQGKDAVALQSDKPPKLTRSQKRYRDYLDVADCFTSFGEYLRETERRRKADAWY